MNKRAFSSIILSFLFFISAIFGLFGLTPIIEGALVEITLEDWDSYNIGVSSGSGIYVDWERILGDDFEIVNDYVDSAPKSLYFTSAGGETGDRGWINITSPENYTEKMDIDFKYSAYNTGASNNDRYTQISMRNKVNQEEIRLRTVSDNDITDTYFQYMDVFGVWHTLGLWSGGASERELTLEITHYTGNQMYYNLSYYGGAQVGSALDSTRRVTDFETIKSIFISYGGSGGGGCYVKFWLDTMTWTWGETPVPPSETYNVTDYEYKGSFCTNFVTGTTKDTLEIERHIDMSGIEIVAVDLLVTLEQYLSDSDLSNYWLVVRGQPLVPDSCYCNNANPSVWIPYGGHYILRWHWKSSLNESLPYPFCNVTIGNVYQSDEIYYYPTFEFIHTEHIYTSVHWKYFYCQDTDLDDDGDYEMGIGDHVQDNDFVFCEYDADTVERDFSYRFYYTGAIFEPPVEYEDTIDTDKDIYDLCNEQEVKIVWTVEHFLNSNYLVIEKGATEYENKTLGDSYHGSYSFFPTETGTYTAKIWRETEGTIVSCTFTVNSAECEYYIYLVPKPVKPDEQFQIYFKYNYTEHPCAVLQYSYNGIIPMDIWQFTDVPIETNFTHNGISTEGIYHFDLAWYIWDNETSSYLYTRLDRVNQIVKNEYSNYIDCLDQIYNYDVGEIVRLIGSHNFLGYPVYILVNYEWEEYIGDESIFNEPFRPQYGGDYQAQLIIKLSGGNLVLDSVNFAVTIPEVEPPVLPPIDPFIGALVGVFIVLGFTFIPLFMVKGMEHINFKIDIPPILYGICASIGTIVPVFIGLWGWEVPFFIVVVALLITVIMWLKGKTGE